MMRSTLAFRRIPNHINIKDKTPHSTGRNVLMYTVSSRANLETAE